MIKPNGVSPTFLVILIFIFSLMSLELIIPTTSPIAEDKAPEKQEITVEGGGKYTNVNPVGLAMMLKNKDFLLINVHIPYEGEIEKTDLFIPYNEIEQNMDKLPSNKETKIVLYCKTDRMSIIAAYTLVKLGFNNVWNLKGGMTAWRQAGYPLIEKKGSFK